LGVEPKQSLDLGVWSLHKVVMGKKKTLEEGLWSKASPKGLSCFLFFIYFIFSTLPTIFLSFWVFLANALGGSSIKECYHCHCHNPQVSPNSLELRGVECGACSVASHRQPCVLMKREVGSSLPVLIIGIAAKKKKKEEKMKQKQKREGHGDGMGAKLHNAITMSSKLI